MIDVKTVTFGTDAELFIRTITGHPFPVCGLFGGTKDNPMPIIGMGKGFYVQEDNAAAEFNIPPNKSIRQFARDVESTIGVLRRKLPDALCFDMDHSSLVFSEEYLRIPNLQVFGCEPDYNAYNETANPRPVPQQPGLRTAAAHVHIGWANPTDEDRLELVRLSDIFVVLPTIRHQTAEDVRRRTMYGKAGAFRPKEYGLEHRVLPNTWIRDRIHIRSTLQKYADAIAALNAGMKVEREDYIRVQEAINRPHGTLSGMLHELYVRKFRKLVGEKWDYHSFYQNFADPSESFITPGELQVAA